jgi:hypothetical protein
MNGGLQEAYLDDLMRGICKLCRFEGERPKGCVLSLRTGTCTYPEPGIREASLIVYPSG